MRSSIAILVVWFSSTVGAVAVPADDFSQRLAGPWGRVDTMWQPLTGALSKASCPLGGVKRPDTVGLFGEGGAMWIEPTFAGSLNVYDGNPVPHLLTYLRTTSAGAVYRESGVERLYRIMGPDQLTIDNEPVVPGLPAKNYVRCLKKK